MAKARMDLSASIGTLLVAERGYFSAESMTVSETPFLSTTTQEILAAIG